MTDDDRRRLKETMERESALLGALPEEAARRRSDRRMVFGGFLTMDGALPPKYGGEGDRGAPEDLIFERMLDMPPEAQGEFARLFNALSAVRSHAISHCFLEDAAGRVADMDSCLAIPRREGFARYPQDALAEEAEAAHHEFMAYLSCNEGMPPFRSVGMFETKDFKAEAHGGGWRVAIAGMPPAGVREPGFPAADVGRFAAKRARDGFVGVFVRKPKAEWAAG